MNEKITVKQIVLIILAVILEAFIFIDGLSGDNKAMMIIIPSLLYLPIIIMMILEKEKIPSILTIVFFAWLLFIEASSIIVIINNLKNSENLLNEVFSLLSHITYLIAIIVGIFLAIYKLKEKEIKFKWAFYVSISLIIIVMGLYLGSSINLGQKITISYICGLCESLVFLAISGIYFIIDAKKKVIE